MIRNPIRSLVAILATAFACSAFAAVDANRASQAELESVKGIGPGLAAKILKARESGTFKNWDDLVERVGGVGAGNAARFSNAGLTVGGAGFDGKPAEPRARKAKAEAADTAAIATDKPARKPRAAKAEAPST